MNRSKEESMIQRGVIEWRDRLMYTRRGARIRWLHAIPNGGSRDKREAANMKREGVTAGIWDLHLPVPCPGVIGDQWHSLWIEVKRPASPGRRRGQLTTEQKAFGQFVREHGNATFVGYCTQSIIDAIVRYLNGEWIQ